jgi:hypothetical protein
VDIILVSYRIDIVEKKLYTGVSFGSASIFVPIKFQLLLSILKRIVYEFFDLMSCASVNVW